MNKQQHYYAKASKCTCIQCSKTFIITPDDEQFYQRVNVPKPTHCPDCRAQRRMVWRNERTLYPRTCDLCKKNIIAIYPATSPYKVYCYDCWYSDKWSALDYGREIDFTRPFFEQLKELQLQVPRPYAFAVNNENSEYTNGTTGCKDCYMIFVSDHNEASLYSYGIFDCQQVMDCINTTKSELCYECIGCTNCYDVQYSVDAHNCTSSMFLLDCKGAQHCFMSSGLRNQEYIWQNKQLTRSEYEQKWADLQRSSHNKINQLHEQFKDLQKKHTFKYYHGLNNEGVTGDYIERCRNAKHVFESQELDNCNYVMIGNKVKDSSDAYVLVDQSELCYEVTSGISLYNVQCSYSIWTGRDSMYSDSCINSNNLFGCIGLRKQQFCILNKQYSEQDYYALRDKLISYMKKTGEYGEYFPITLSPFAYNETVAQEQFPLSKTQVKANGWRWQEPKEVVSQYSDYRICDQIESVKDNVLQTVLCCQHCKRNYKILPQELSFYRQQHIPLPHLCFNCRHLARLQQKNPRALWQRQCMCTQTTHQHASTGSARVAGQCATEFETTYSDKNPALVYCEECYLKELN